MWTQFSGTKTDSRLAVIITWQLLQGPPCLLFPKGGLLSAPGLHLETVVVPGVFVWDCFGRSHLRH